MASGIQVAIIYTKNIEFISISAAQLVLKSNRRGDEPLKFLIGKLCFSVRHWKPCLKQKHDSDSVQYSAQPPLPHGMTWNLNIKKYKIVILSFSTVNWVGSKIKTTFAMGKRKNSSSNSKVHFSSFWVKFHSTHCAAKGWKKLIFSNWFVFRLELTFQQRTWRWESSLKQNGSSIKRYRKYKTVWSCFPHWFQPFGSHSSSGAFWVTDCHATQARLA